MLANWVQNKLQGYRQTILYMLNFLSTSGDIRQGHDNLLAARTAPISINFVSAYMTPGLIEEFIDIGGRLYFICSLRGTDHYAGVVLDLSFSSSCSNPKDASFPSTFC